jgi:hypothetical protein
VAALTAQRKTKGYGRAHVYKTPYTRKSGDQNTSLGNTHNQFVAHSAAVDYAMVMLKGEIDVVDYKMIGLGDDNLLAVKFAEQTSDEDKKRFFEYVEKRLVAMGLKPKMSIPKTHSYCSGFFMPVLRNGKPCSILVPSPIRKVAKMGWCADATVKFDPIMRLKGNELGNPVNAYVPVSRVFYDYYSKKAGTEKHAEKRWVTYMSTDDKIETTGDSMSWFCEAFGVTHEEVQDLENFIHSHLEKTEGGASFWTHPVMDRMITKK